MTTQAEQRDEQALRLAGLVQAANSLLQLERLARTGATAPIRMQLASVFSRTAAEYVQMFGSLEAAPDPLQVMPLQRQLAVRLETIERDYSQFLTRSAQQALEQGVDHAVSRATTAGGVVNAADFELSPEVEQAIEAVAGQVDDKLQQAAAMTVTMKISTFADLQAPMAKAYSAAAAIDQTAAWTVNRSSNDGIAAVAGRTGGKLLWIAERDACLVCLALSGHLADPATGEMFDEDATFGKPGSAPSVWPYEIPLTGPPRHPWCRCRLEIWYGVTTPVGGPLDSALYGANAAMGGGVDLPAALRREAKRSVLRGWSMPSESGKARVEAADRLLKAGSGMPKSVERAAKTAVRNGRYEDRSVPFDAARRR